MKIIIKTTNIKLGRGIRKYIQEKIGELEKFAKIFQEEEHCNGFFGKGKPRVEAWVEVGKTTLHHRKGLVFRTEVQMRLPGKSIRAEAVGEDLKLAIVEVKNELQRELKQYKGKAEAVTKRRARKSKKLFRLSPLARFKRRKGERNREEGI
jgi:ribosomal subunit interface protein